VKVWRRAASFDAGRVSPISWLAMIARNATINWRRTQQQHGQLEDATCAIADDTPLPDAIAVEDEERRRLLACLGGLDGGQSNAIRRAFLDS